MLRKQVSTNPPGGPDLPQTEEFIFSTDSVAFLNPASDGNLILQGQGTLVLDGSEHNVSKKHPTMKISAQELLKPMQIDQSNIHIQSIQSDAKQNSTTQILKLAARDKLSREKQKLKISPLQSSDQKDSQSSLSISQVNKIPNNGEILCPDTEMQGGFNITQIGRNPTFRSGKITAKEPANFTSIHPAASNELLEALGLKR